MIWNDDEGFSCFLFLVEADRGQASADASLWGYKYVVLVWLSAKWGIYWSWSRASERSVTSLPNYRCNVESISVIPVNRAHRVGEQHTTYNIQHRVSYLILTDLLLFWRKGGLKVDGRKEGNVEVLGSGIGLAENVSINCLEKLKSSVYSDLKIKVNRSIR